MARALWRWWVEENGTDAWWARVETGVGQWAEVVHADYESAGYTPRFWDLPLKDDYLEAGMIEPLDIQFQRAELMIMPGVIILMIALGGIAATLLAVFVFFNR